MVSGHPAFVCYDAESGTETRLATGHAEYVYVPLFVPHRAGTPTRGTRRSS